MKTTLYELNELFCLKDITFRQIKKGLNNKIKIVNEYDVEIKNKELESILTSFKTCGVSDLTTASKKYGISKATLQNLAKEKIIDSFKLYSEKGSKILFLNSELEKENKILLIHSKKTCKSKLSSIFSKLMIPMVENNLITKREHMIFSMFYINDIDVDEIAKNLDLTRERVRQLLVGIKEKVPHILRYYLNYKQTNDDYQKMYLELKTKYEKLCKN